MFGKLTLIALVGAVSVSANSVANLLTRSEHSAFLARQFTAAQIPSACQSQCTQTLTIYQACTTGDTNTCLSVCQPAIYSSFVSCLQCVLSNTPGVTAAEITSLNGVLNQLGSACSQAGSPVSSTSLAASAASRSGSASGVSASASSAIASVTGSASASVTSALSTGAIASVSSALNSGSSSLAAASSSRAAGDALAPMPQGLHAVALGLVGVVAGAAFVL